MKAPDRRSAGVEGTPATPRGCIIGALHAEVHLVSAIEVENLRRVYRTTVGVIRRRAKEVLAVDDLSFEVAAGELFGLLGPNGAGKTTMVKMLTTLLIPTAGRGKASWG